MRLKSVARKGDGRHRLGDQIIAPSVGRTGQTGRGIDLGTFARVIQRDQPTDVVTMTARSRIRTPYCSVSIGPPQNMVPRMPLVDTGVLAMTFWGSFVLIQSRCHGERARQHVQARFTAAPIEDKRLKVDGDVRTQSQACLVDKSKVPSARWAR